jgi:hypothetical protein
MTVYKVEVLHGHLSKQIKEKDIEKHLSNHLEEIISEKLQSGWDFVSLSKVTLEVKTSFFSKRKQIDRNVAIFKKLDSFRKEVPEQIERQSVAKSILIGPATKKRL